MKSDKFRAKQMMTRKRMIILMYHMISETDHLRERKYALPPGKFRKQMRYLKDKGYVLLSLDTYCDYIKGKLEDFPDKALAITFDDGYMDNYENALPILGEYGFPASIFIVSGLIGKENTWTRKENYPSRRLMRWRELEEMKRHGILIGSHTVNHFRLSELQPPVAVREIADSKKALEDGLGYPVNHFAYPYGDLNESVIDMVKEAGYETACSTRAGFNSENIDLLLLRRLEICGTDALWQFAIKLTYGTNDGDLFLPARYYFKRLANNVGLKC